MTTYVELQKKIDDLQKQADALKTKERDTAIAGMKEAIKVYDITAADLGLDGDAKRGPKAAVANGRAKKPLDTKAAYADKDGNTWVGRGPRPAWLRAAIDGGAKLEDFAVVG